MTQPLEVRTILGDKTRYLIVGKINMNDEFVTLLYYLVYYGMIYI